MKVNLGFYLFKHKYLLNKYMMFIGWKLLLKVAISILVISHKNVEGKENEEEDTRIREANHPLISLKDWFQWVSDPTSKCEKYGDKLTLGTFT